MKNIAPDNALIICHAATAARLLLNHQGGWYGIGNKRCDGIRSIRRKSI